MAEHYMNPAHGAHMASAQHKEMQPPKPGGKKPGHGKPSIHIHSHAKGHTVHIMHPSGEHQMHEHEPGDAEGISQHIQDNLGDGGGMPEAGPEPEPMGDTANL